LVNHWFWSRLIRIESELGLIFKTEARFYFKTGARIRPITEFPLLELELELEVIDKSKEPPNTSLKLEPAVLV
jgi:hypothetical protein